MCISSLATETSSDVLLERSILSNPSYIDDFYVCSSHQQWACCAPLILSPFSLSSSLFPSVFLEHLTSPRPSVRILKNTSFLSQRLWENINKNNKNPKLYTTYFSYCTPASKIKNANICIAECQYQMDWIHTHWWSVCWMKDLFYLLMHS